MNLEWTAQPATVIAFGGAALSFQAGDQIIGMVAPDGSLLVIDFGAIASAQPPISNER